MARKIGMRLAVIICIGSGSALGGNIIHVPANQPTIQAGINVASNGDTVLVAPGTYYEKINFLGKAITVKSSNGPSVTTIANNSGGVTVNFNTGEGAASVLQGFTITGGIGTVGIVIGSSPTILNNRITGNHSCDGAGITVDWGSPVIKGNTIFNNFHDQCSGGVGGAGISVIGQGTTKIIGNVISGNDGGNGFTGGGISLWAAGSPMIMNNIIRNNTISTQGGGLGIGACCSNAVIAQNVFSGNSAPEGGAVDSFPNSGVPVFVNNTFVNNQSNTGNSAVWINSASGEPSLFYNNIIVALAGQVALFCGSFNTTTLPVVMANDVYAPQGTRYGNLCSDQTGINGNISANPLFVASSNFRLKGGSPAVDAGNNSAPGLPSKDFVGSPRIINGYGGTSAIVDMGAYEFVPVVLAPKGLSFGIHTVGSTSSKIVKLTNSQKKVLNISSYSVPTGYSVSGCGTSVAAFTSCTLTVTFHPLASGTFKGSVIVKDDAGNTPQTVALSGSAQ
jgi:hypothetical protein